MTIAEIKKEALRLMFAAMRDIDAADIASLEGDSLCADYLAAMTGAINRCLSDLERKLALTPVQWETAKEEWRHTAHTSRLSLSGREGLYAVLAVSTEDGTGYTGNVAYALEGGELVLPRLSEQTTVRVVYAPCARRAERYDNGETLASVPETLAALVPYFIKSELFREEEPAEAGEARNFYEAGVEDYLVRTSVGGVLGGGRVGTVYSQVML